MSDAPMTTLAREINKKINGASSALRSEVSCEIGTITDDGLMLDLLERPITGYLVSDLFERMDDILDMLQTIADYISESSIHNEEGGLDPIIEIAKEEYAPLKTGDRVIAIPISGGNNYVVVGRVV